MTMNTKQPVTTDIEARLARRAELKRSLEDRRRQLVMTLHDRLREVRTEHGSNMMRGGPSDGEAPDIDIEEDIELAVIQMRAETLGRIDEAIARLDAGVYGQCSSCGEEIATSRLRALPFAVRCRECEEQDEAERGRARMGEGRRHPFFMDRNNA